MTHLRELFRRFPHKSFHRRFQGIDAGALADFFVRAEERRLDKAMREGRTCQWIAVEDGEPKAFTALHGDSWHSKFYPWRFGRIAPFLTHGASAGARALLLETALEAARADGFDHLTARIDGAEYGALESMREKGFFLVDSSVKMSAPLKSVPDLGAPSRAGSMRLRPWRAEDTAALKRIAAAAHPMNHYYQDPWLSRPDSNRLFEAWVERCCDQLASRVFVLDRAGQVEGFVIYLIPETLNAALGSRLVILDFVCLAQRARGGGLGSWLISESLRRLDDRFSMVELRTSHHNYPALTCYQSLNLRLTSTDFILHRHEETARQEGALP